MSSHGFHGFGSHDHAAHLSVRRQDMKLLHKLNQEVVFRAETEGFGFSGKHEEPVVFFQ